MHGLLGQKGPHTIPSIWGQKQASLRLKTLAQASNRSMMAASTLPKLETSLSKRMRDVYVAREADDDLDKEYGDNQGGPPKNRRAGIILHPTSLPGPYGIGEIGKETFRFLDWLETSGCMAWQVLPLVPPERQYWSPYSGLDAMCGNIHLIALDELAEEGLIDQSDLPGKIPIQEVDYSQVAKTKEPILRKATERLFNDSKFADLKAELDKFRSEESWVEDSALFYCLANIKEETKDKAWWTWPGPLRFREKEALEAASQEFKDQINTFVGEQFLFDRQWKAVKAYANERNISIIGDMPIYVGAQSADVWCFPDLFQLGESGAPTSVSGVPPDAFSESGQLWGSPLFDWKAQKKAKYVWWERRLGRAFQLYDETRIDHFRGFAGYWSVDAKEETAMHGFWKKGPGKDLFDVLDQKMKGVPIIAEDLGVITPDVHELRESIGAPGMVVLQFAWGSGSANTHLPHNHYENSVCYPGTHDNETMVGWWQDSATERDKNYLKQYTGVQEVSDIAWLLLREAFKSVSRTSIVMMQDVMRLDNKSRMNFPGTVKNNWVWRIGDTDIWQKLSTEAEDLHELLRAYDRLHPSRKTNKP